MEESDSNRASLDLEEFDFEDPSNQSQTGSCTFSSKVISLN